MTPRPDAPGRELGAVDWSCWSVVLLKPDCIRQNLTEPVLDRLVTAAEIVHHTVVTAEDWQVFVHYWDLLVDRHSFPELDVPACLRTAYAGQQVGIALAHGPSGTPHRLRALLGHFDPAQARPGTIRADLGTDSLNAARSERRLVENLVHTSDDPHATGRDFGTWYGAEHQYLLDRTASTT